MQIEILYSPDCPNVAQTRANLSEALSRVKASVRWREWNLADRNTPARLRRFGSPTVLVDGTDVDDTFTGTDAVASGCCRIYANAEGAPSPVPAVPTLTRAIERRLGGQERSTWKRTLASLPATGAALLPAAKCPACLAAYTGVFSSLGLTNVLLTEILLPLTVVLVVISLATLAFRASRRHGYGPFSLGALASAALFIGKFWFDWPIAWYGGVAALVVASVWNAWPRRAAPPSSCPACASGSK